MTEDRIIKKLIERDKKFDWIDKRFDGVDKRLDGVDKRLDGIDKRLDEHDKKFDRVIKKLIEHDERFERIEEKVDKMVTREEYLRGYDEMITILRRLDQERIFGNQWVKRIEKRVDGHDQEIAQIKQVLNIK